MIEDAVRQSRPFSFVRAGDGSGLLLGYGLAAPTPDDMDSFSRHFGPKVLLPQYILEMQALLEHALVSADLVGLSWATLSGEDLAARHPDMEKHGIVRHGWLRQWWRENHHRTRGVISDAHLQWELARSDYWHRLLRGQRWIGLINASPTLPGKLEKVLGVEVLHFRLPDRFVNRDWWEDDQGREPIYPDAWRRITTALRHTDLSGTIVLVGAGIMAKAYCQAVKELGGISLEMGALLDLWDGRSTRPRVLKRLSSSPEDFSLDRFV